MCDSQGCFCPAARQRLGTWSPHGLHAAPAAEQRLSKQLISLPHRMATHVLAQRASQQPSWPWLNGVYQSRPA